MRLQRTMLRLQSSVRIFHAGLVLCCLNATSERSISMFYRLCNVLFLPLPRKKEDFLLVCSGCVMERAESGHAKHNTCPDLRVRAAAQAADGVVFRCRWFIFGLLSQQQDKMTTHNTIISVGAGCAHLYYCLISPAKIEPSLAPLASCCARFRVNVTFLLVSSALLSFTPSWALFSCG